MRITGMRYGAPILKLAGFPVPEVLKSNATYESIEALIEKRGKVVVKPIFYGGVGKKGKAGLVKIVDNVQDAMAAKRQLFFAEHQFHNEKVIANGVTFEEFIPSEYEIYFNLNISTISRRPEFTLSIDGGIDIEELPPDRIVSKSFDPLTGLKNYHIIDALAELNAPQDLVSALVRHLPKLWELYNDYGFITLELNPIRVERKNGRLHAIACDFKGMLDQDNLLADRLNLPAEIFETNLSEFEIEVNQLRTYQGQSDVAVINPEGTITSFMFGGGANSAATEILSEKTTISSDFGGNPPYEKMYHIARIVYNYWLEQSNVLLIIGGLGGDNPDELLVKGSIAIHSNSGNFSTTITEYLKTQGFGDTTLVSSGKDTIIQYPVAEFLYAAQNDERTKAGVLYIEPGGFYEKIALDMIQNDGNGFVSIRYILKAFGTQQDFDPATANIDVEKIANQAETDFGKAKKKPKPKAVHTNAFRVSTIRYLKANPSMLTRVKILFISNLPKPVSVIRFGIFIKHWFKHSNGKKSPKTSMPSISMRSLPLSALN